MIKLLILIGLVKLLDLTENPWLCATLYAIAIFSFVAFSANPNWVSILIITAVSFVASFIYFYLLNRTKETCIYWLILMLGLVIGFVL